MTARDIPSTLAPLLELLELEQPRVVTTSELEGLAREAGISWPVDVVVRRLRERGWLLDLQTRGAWEFAPAARAGALAAGDPMIELRAWLKKDPSLPFTVGAESAAYRLGLSSRRPDPETIAAPKEARLPKGFRKFRVARWKTTRTVRRDDLPVWTVETLLAFMASQPASYRDWPNVGEWIHEAASQASVDELGEELSGKSRAAWARAAYLLDRGGHTDNARRLLERAPRGKGPYYMGSRRGHGRYFKEYDIVDTTGMEVSSE